MTETFGPALADLAATTGVIEPAHELRYSSGLTRPDFHDWPAHLQARLDRSPVDILVFMIGANDAQPIETGSGTVPFGDPRWLVEYRQRVERAADILAAGSRTVYWIGQPVARPAGYRERMAALNGVYQDVAAERPAFRYVSSWELFQDADGGYRASLPDGEGRLVTVRGGDGIHLTAAGGRRLATRVIQAIEEDWRLAPDG